MQKTGQGLNWSRSSVTLEQAATELLRRMDAAADLIAFTEYTFKAYQTAATSGYASQLERVEQGEVDRLMLLVPPRHGKSELALRRFPAYYLGKHPERQFISASVGNLAKCPALTQPCPWIRFHGRRLAWRPGCDIPGISGMLSRYAVRFV